MKKIITAALAADIPILLWGPPGTGKTATLISLAQEVNAYLEILIGSTIDPTDVSGLPILGEGVTRYAPPIWAERLSAAVRRGQQAWLLLDELSCAPAAVQAALLRVVQERRVGDINIAGTRIIGAANRAEHATDGGWLSAAAANRWAHVDWAPNLAAWSAGQIRNWGQPSSSPSQARWCGVIVGFLARRPNLFCLPPKNDDNAWPSPRSWSAAIRLLAADASIDVGIAATSCVGSAAAAELAEWVVALDLPAPEQLLAGAKLPTRGDQIAAALSGLVAHVIAEEPNRVNDAWDILGRCRPDVALTPASALLAAIPDIIHPVAITLGGKIRKIGGGT